MDIKEPIFVNNDDECRSLVEEIVKTKLECLLLKRKKRLLMEELYRQFLEGEVDPKKRIKRASEPPVSEKEKEKPAKKLKSAVNSNSNGSTNLVLSTSNPGGSSSSSESNSSSINGVNAILEHQSI